MMLQRRGAFEAFDETGNKKTLVGQEKIKKN
jgi:hypothetical protein